jgi:hypothetical protein
MGSLRTLHTSLKPLVFLGHDECILEGCPPNKPIKRMDAFIWHWIASNLKWLSVTKHHQLTNMTFHLEEIFEYRDEGDSIRVHTHPIGCSYALMWWIRKQHKITNPVVTCK